MKKLNSLILNITVNFLDFIYSGRSLQRFWVLEVIARSPYFAFLSVLHFKESLGIKNEKTMILMKEHFYQAINETEHLKEMEKRGGDRFWIDRFFARHLVLVYYWIMVFYYFLSPANAYDVNIKIEEHAFETYSKYLIDNPNDQKIKEISQDQQVLCITHQPFLAAAGLAHFKVKKNVINGITYTSISKLTTKKQRKLELVELIGGGFGEANDYASRLIERAAA